MKKISKRLKRMLLIVLAVAMLVPVPLQSGLAATQRQRALKAYNKMMSAKTVYLLSKGEIYHKYMKYKGSKPSNVQFSIIYLDNDSIPELVARDGRDVNTVYTYRNGKLVRLYGFATTDPARYYYKKKGVIVFKHNTGNYEFVNVYRMIKGELIEKLYRYNIGDGDNYYLLKQIKTGHTDKKISYKKYKSLLRSYSKGARIKKIVYHKNTKANRKKFLK